MFISKTLSQITAPYNPDLTPAVWLMMMLPVMVALSFIRTYRTLAVTSGFGLFAALFAIVFTVYDAAKYHDVKSLESYPSVKWDTYALFMGNAAFLFLTPTVMLPLEQSMRQMDRVNRNSSSKKNIAKHYQSSSADSDDSALQSILPEDEAGDGSDTGGGRWMPV